MRKPMPFGTEFKTCCTACGIMTFMEIQKGANKQQEVRAHSNYSDYPAKASMTLRMCENMTPGMTAIGDADFGSIHSAYGLALDGKGSILNIKTAHAFIPKAEIEEALKGTAAGTSMVWTTTIDRIRFNVIGYKYARFKKVQIFIATVGAVTSDWKPYIAKFKDFQNKTVSRPILRPKVLSVAFTLLNRVDIHNQGRCVNSSHNYIIRILIHSYIYASHYESNEYTMHACMRARAPDSSVDECGSSTLIMHSSTLKASHGPATRARARAHHAPRAPPRT
jgi:hypothetical protein